jgi:hypothetical protein
LDQALLFVMPQQAGTGVRRPRQLAYLHIQYSITGFSGFATSGNVKRHL